VRGAVGGTGRSGRAPGRGGVVGGYVWVVKVEQRCKGNSGYLCVVGKGEGGGGKQKRGVYALQPMEHHQVTAATMMSQAITAE